MTIPFWQIASGLGAGVFTAALFFGVIKQFGRKRGEGFQVSQLGAEATAIIAVLIILIFGGITVLALVLYAPSRISEPQFALLPTPTPTPTPTPPRNADDSASPAPVIGNYPDTDGLITFSPSEVHVGETVTFTVHPAGGTTGYQYDWYGSVTGHTPSITQVYNTPGEKLVAVRIYSYGPPKLAFKMMEVRP